MKSKEIIRTIVREAFLNEAPPGGMFGNFKHLKRKDSARYEKSYSSELESAKSWYEHPVFDRGNALDNRNQKMIKDGFEKAESIILNSYHGNDKESFSEIIKNLFKEYEPLLEKGFDDVSGMEGAISSNVIKSLRNLSSKVGKILSKKTPSAFSDKYVRSWLQLK
jgi:hypothetical protein